MSTPRRTTAERLHPALAYIEAHLEQPCTVHLLATLLDLSPSRFRHLFRQGTGVSLYQWMLRQRIEHAKRLLLRGDSVATLSVTLGFCDQSHFGAVFKRWTGTSPARFRDSHHARRVAE